MQIFVGGMHRSGTSMVARLLNLMGAYFGPEGSALAVNRENPKGFWERSDIVELNDRILAAAGAIWYDIHPFLARPSEWQLPASVDDDLRRKVIDIDANRPWFIKDPRLCLTLPYWRAHAECPVAIVCSRRPDAVVNSLAKRSEIIGVSFTYDEALALWEAYNVSMLQAVAGMPTVFVRYEDVLKSPVEASRRLFGALQAHGVDHLRMPRDREIRGFVDPALQRSAEGASAPALPPRIDAIDSALRDTAASDVTVPRLLAETLRTLHTLQERLAATRRDALVLAGLNRKRGDISAAIAHAAEQRDPARAWSVERLRELASAVKR